jgi:hypothetical protein
MNVLIVGGGQGSWQIRGVQLGAAIGARTTSKPSDAAIQWADVVVCVKRALFEWAAKIHQFKKPIVWDALDFWDQPAQNSLSETEARALLREKIDRYEPLLVIGATESMAAACRGVYLPHHARPGMVLRIRGSNRAKSSPTKAPRSIWAAGVARSKRSANGAAGRSRSTARCPRQISSSLCETVSTMAGCAVSGRAASSWSTRSRSGCPSLRNRQRRGARFTLTASALTHSRICQQRCIDGTSASTAGADQVETGWTTRCHASPHGTRPCSHAWDRRWRHDHRSTRAAEALVSPARVGRRAVLRPLHRGKHRTTG